MSQSYWQDATADEAMQDEHAFVWRAMLETIDIDLVGKRVLDAGCNQGGFLRLLADRCGIAEGFGYDPAAGAVEDTRRLGGRGPFISRRAPRCPSGGVASRPPSATRCSTSSTTSPATLGPSSKHWSPAGCTTRSWVFTPVAR